MLRPMLDPSHPIVQLLQEDRRYTLDAYVFIFEALQYAQDVLHMGAECPSERPQQPTAESAGQTEARISEREQHERHVTGQELCEAIRRYALEQYGYMAKTVLNSWGLRTDERLRRNRLQPDPRGTNAEDALRHARGFRQRLRFRRGPEARLQDHTAEGRRLGRVFPRRWPPLGWQLYCHPGATVRVGYALA